MRLLIIEDEPKTANYLKKGLNEHGFITDVATNGEDGIHYATHQKYDLLILDLMLPKKDGWGVLVDLRNNGCQTPILLLTAQDSVRDKVKGLELGADDYLVKPFAFSELLARIRTILRRGQINIPDIVTLADLEIDFLKRKAKRADVRLELTPKEFALLSLFMRRTGEVISRTIIAEQIWDMNFDSDTNVVDVAVKRLRRKIDDPFETKLIHTIRGVGYVLELREG